MTAPESPPLPEPVRRRWQPLRLGLVELYHYDCEEFWFRDGHLLLRGNNGTGKSKVLSLTLPFLLDASLSSSRVEPDGDRSKRMEWNLLMNRYERRIGYAWIEFGRIDDDGRPQILTLGCGMQAVAGRTRIDAWHFLTEQRIGRDLWLITPERTAVSRDRLEQALGGHGQVFDTARDYRRAVDERLFRLGETRYTALIDTLIQLRQPQLSKKPDENSLSAALGNALPELSRQVLEDVAEAMNQLDEYRDELMQIERVRDAVSQFGQRYGLYARIQARRQARELRQAQTAWDNASRVLNESRQQLEAAKLAAGRLAQRCADLELQLLRDRAALEELRADPLMRDARRLRELERAAETSIRERDEAERRWRDALQALEREQSESALRQEQAGRAHDELRIQATAASKVAEDIGNAGDHARATDHRVAGDATAQEIETLQAQLSTLAARRAEQIQQLRRRLKDRDESARRRLTVQQQCDAGKAVLEAAENHSRAADAQLHSQAGHLLGMARRYLSAVEILPLRDTDAALADLSEWMESLTGPNPLQLRIAQAQLQALQELSDQRSLLANRAADLRTQDRALADEQGLLDSGQERLPSAPPTRDPQARIQRQGAPLWQLIEFRDSIEPAARAGLEAALEASGMLDAWVSPEGGLLHPDTRDTWLLPRKRCAQPLLGWLLPAVGAQAPQVEALLHSIACADEDQSDAEAWVSPQGRFRIGGLRGAWRKPQAEFIGFAARAAARQRRLLEIAALRAQLRRSLDEVEAQEQALNQRQQGLEQELRAAPPDDALRDAHACYSASEIQRRAAQERLAAIEANLQQLEQVFRRLQSELEQDAADLRLPAESERLRELELALSEYRRSIHSLVVALHSRVRCAVELSRQIGREARAQTDVDSRARESDERRRTAEEVGARRDELRAAAGTAIEALERRLKDKEAAVVSGGETLKAAQQEWNEAGKQESRLEQKAEDAIQVLNERAEARRCAVERLRGFAGTGLLAQALPDLEQPEPAAWTIDPALNLARRVEQLLSDVADDDGRWNRVQNEISRDYTALGQALSALGQQALMEQSDYGLIVQIVYRSRPQRPDLLERALAEEVEQRRGILSAHEREVLENHLQAEVAASLQRLLREAEARVLRINEELKRRPTSTGVYFRLDWEPLPEGGDGAPVGLAAARGRLLNRVADAWSADDRRLVGEFLQNRIASERADDDGGTLLEHLVRALDYRRWHRFRVKRWHDGAWRPLSGPASSGERALGLTVPLFAAASSHYASAESPHAPRLVLLDEAFAGIDDEARSHCMALIREFDLDFVMTSEREWGCYATLPGVAISQIVRREGIDAVFVSRWSWDGRVRREEADPARRYPDAVTA